MAGRLTSTVEQREMNTFMCRAQLASSTFIQTIPSSQGMAPLTVKLGLLISIKAIKAIPTDKPTDQANADSHLLRLFPLGDSIVCQADN